MNLNLPVWAKSILIGGIAAVAAFITDNKDFSLTGGKWEHLVEAFIGGAASTFLLLFRTPAPAPAPPPSVPPPKLPEAK